ncbi:MAG: DUF4383 domain-containing protein [Mycobacteriales bacterium]
MDEHLPLDSPLGGVYRVGGAVIGFILLVFGIWGFLTGPQFITTTGTYVLGLHTNGLLSLVSLVFAAVLIGGAVVGGNVAAATNTGVGALLLVSGLVNLTVLRTDANFLAFTMSNVIFSFVVGVILLAFGLYGRVSTGEPGRADSSPVSRGSNTT